MTLNPNWPALSGVIEALLFVAERPLSENDIVEVLLKQRDEDIENAEDLAELAPESSPAGEGVVAAQAEAFVALDVAVDVDGSVAVNVDVATLEPELPFAPEPALEAESPTRKIDDVPLDEVVSFSATTSTAQMPTISDPRVELKAAVKDALAELMRAYESPSTALGQGFELVCVAGGYQLRTNARVASFVRHFLQVKPTRLSRAQLETLAIVAYRQPVTRPEIEQIRGVDCGASMKTLLERKLVRILGKKEDVGRPLLYGTTKEFLEFFNLKGLMELPTLREFQELSEEHQRKVEEELDRDKPLGSMKELAENAPQLAIDDSALISDLDAALTNARHTVNRVAEVTGLKALDEDSAPPPAAEGREP